MFNLPCCWKKKIYRFIHHFSYFPLLTSAWWAVFSAINHGFGRDNFTLLKDASQQLSFKSTSLTLCSSIALLPFFHFFLKRISTFLGQISTLKFTEIPRAIWWQTRNQKTSSHCLNEVPYYCGVSQREGAFSCKWNVTKWKKILRSESSKKIPYCTKKIHKKQIKKIIIIKDPLQKKCTWSFPSEQQNNGHNVRSWPQTILLFSATSEICFYSSSEQNQTPSDDCFCKMDSCENTHAFTRCHKLRPTDSVAGLDDKRQFPLPKASSESVHLRETLCIQHSSHKENTKFKGKHF